ncbi:unnamed protein product [Haemonchus placei]|uniref:P4Hc domain-containing protein n=1 Tax=Haemonchus placei TaxID=6290 RepID=A0A0N4WY09_HAEPC|nr:unnamed protein product [Haemonchus placei]
MSTISACKASLTEVLTALETTREVDNEAYMDYMQQSKIEDGTVAAEALIHTLHARLEEVCARLEALRSDSHHPKADNELNARVLKKFFASSKFIDGLLYVQFPWKASHPKLLDRKELEAKRRFTKFNFNGQSETLLVFFGLKTRLARKQATIYAYFDLHASLSGLTRHHLCSQLPYNTICTVFAGPLFKEIERNTYVNNVAFGAETHDEAIKKYETAKSVFGDMHMNLRHFVCNSKLVNNSTPQEDRVASSEHTTLLGIVWNYHKDLLSMTIKTLHVPIHSKRTALRAPASKYDPLGLLTPFFSNVEMFVQDRWAKELTWNNALDHSDRQRWSDLLADPKYPLPSVPRLVIPADKTPSCGELCVFGDVRISSMSIRVSYLFQTRYG